MTEPKVVHEWSNRRLLEWEETSDDYESAHVYTVHTIEYESNGEWIQTDRRHEVSGVMRELARLAGELERLKRELNQYHEWAGLEKEGMG